jgi:hypothetical protein
MFAAPRISASVLPGIVLAAGTIIASGCARRVDTPPPAVPVVAQIDSVRGTLVLTGNLPLAQLIVRWGSGVAEAVALTGPLTESLAGLTGLEVMVRGGYGEFVASASPAGLRGFVAEDFVVRAGDDGTPAHDGVIAHQDGRWVLMGHGGAVLAAPFLPDALRHQEGTRVYLLGPLSAPPLGYGVIRLR